MNSIKKEGFTLIELIIVIVIIAILTVIAVPIFKGYIEKARQTEGKALLERIGSFEKVYNVEYDSFYTCEITSMDRTMNIDARTNKYFTTFSVQADGDHYHAVAVYKESPLTLKGSLTDASSFIYADEPDAGNSD